MNEQKKDSLVNLILKKGEMFRHYLNEQEPKTRWLFSLFVGNPVRIKNLEKIAGHLHNLLMYIETQQPSHGSHAEENALSLRTLLDQLNDPARLSSNNAWELADLLEIELIRCGDECYIYTLLSAENGLKDSQHRWEKYFPTEALTSLQENFRDGRFRDPNKCLEARQKLEYLQRSRIGEYRRDRAKGQLRGTYLGRMAIVLGLLIAGLSYFYSAVDNDSANLLPVVLTAGAVGSALSRAVKLGKERLNEMPKDQTTVPPLGIRTLISEWAFFLAQPVIGATTALILFFVFYSGLLPIGDLKPAGYGLMGFLAGFSEPFFLGILDKVAGQAAGSLE